MGRPGLGSVDVDKVSLELRVRQVAKQSGSCRQALSICEEALQQASEQDGKIKLARAPLGVNDPLNGIQALPLEHQVLLCALTRANSAAAMKLSEACKGYKELCVKLRQPASLASKGHVSNALTALEQRGLLCLRSVKGKKGETVAELAVSHQKIRERLPAFLQSFA